MRVCGGGGGARTSPDAPLVLRSRGASGGGQLGAMSVGRVAQGLQRRASRTRDCSELESMGGGGLLESKLHDLGGPSPGSPRVPPVRRGAPQGRPGILGGFSLTKALQNTTFVPRQSRKH